MEIKKSTTYLRKSSLTLSLVKYPILVFQPDAERIPTTMMTLIVPEMTSLRCRGGEELYFKHRVPEKM